MKKRWKIGLWLVIGLVPFTIISVVCNKLNYANQSEWADYSTESIGAILYLFVEDQGRMPKDMDELQSKGYIEVRDHREAHAGRTTLGRETPWTKVFNRPIYDLSEMKIGFGDAWRTSPVIQGSPRFDEAEGAARRASIFIVDLLDRKHQIITTRASSEPSVQTP